MFCFHFFQVLQDMGWKGEFESPGEKNQMRILKEMGKPAFVEKGVGSVVRHGSLIY